MNPQTSSHGKAKTCRHVHFIPARGSVPPAASVAPVAQTSPTPALLLCHQCKVGTPNPGSGRPRSNVYCDRCLDIQEFEQREYILKRTKVHIRTLPCADCGAEVLLGPTARVTGLLTAYRLCPPCSVADDARIDAEHKTMREKAYGVRSNEWRIMCPVRYRIRDLDHASTPEEREEMTDPDRIPKDIREIAKSWRYNPRGLYVIGAHGSGKTRAMMLHLRTLMIEESIGCQYLFSVEFADKVRSLALENARKLDHYIDTLVRVPVLFLDDLGKEKCTDKVSEELFRIVERRSAATRPILVASNLTPEMLSHKIDRDSGTGTIGGLSSGRGVAIVRRLTDYGDCVSID